MRRRFLPLLCCLLLSLGVARARIGPPMLQPSSFIVGGWGHPDNLGNHWLLVWVAEQLWAGKSILHNPEYYVPYGDYPWLAGNGSEGFLYLPFHLIFGWPVGVSVLLTMLFVAQGFAGYALGRVLGGGPWLSLIASSVLLSTPYLSRELSGGRFSQVDVFWLTAAVASFLWLWKTKVRWAGLLCGFFVGVTAVLYWYYGFFFVLGAILIVLASWVGQQAVPWKPIGIAAVVSIIIAGPVLAIYLFNWHLIPGVAEETFPATEAYNDALAPTWPIFHQPGRRAGATQSVPTLLLVVFALWKGIRSEDHKTEILTALLFILFFWLLAMGPNTPVFETVYGAIGPLKRFWWPSRHLMMTNFGYVLLAMLGARLLWPQRQQLWGPLVAVAIPISIWIQGDRPFHAFHAPVKLPPEAYVQLSEMDGDGIVQPPLNPKIATTQAPLLFQMFHRKRMLNGHALWVDRVRPPDWDAMVEEHPLLGPLRRYEEADFSGEIIVSEEDIRALLDLGLVYVVIDKELFCTRTPQALVGYAKVLSHHFGRPILRESGVSVWDLRKWSDAGPISLPAWTWPSKVTKGNGSRGLWGPLHDSNVLITDDPSPDER